MKKRFIAAVVFALLFLLLIYAVRFVDTAAIGPGDTVVGLSRINQTVHNLTGVNWLWYNITEYIGYGALAIAAIFALVGLVQLIRGRSFLNVDREIYILACLYIVTAGLYVFFEYFIINYRPVIMPGELLPEASFPSSHTMLAIVVPGSTYRLLKKYVRPAALRVLLRILCVVGVIVAVGGRLYSGVHWVTDILGGILLSVVLLCLFGGILEKLGEAYVPTHYRYARERAK